MGAFVVLGRHFSRLPGEYIKEDLIKFPLLRLRWLAVLEKSQFELFVCDEES